MDEAPPAAGTGSTAVATPICGAKTRAADRHPCRNAAGYRTIHPGKGRCWRHGGIQASDQRLKHGRYSMVRSGSLGKLITEHRENPEALNVMDEIAALRAVFQTIVEAKSPDLDLARRTLDSVVRAVATVESIRAQSAVARAELLRIFTDFARVVETYVTDPVQRESIRQGWSNVRVM
jgi:hypothetical protein